MERRISKRRRPESRLGSLIRGDAAAVSTACSGPKIIAQESVNTLGIFDVVNHRVARAGDSIAMEGPITALWPSGNGAIAVMRNKSVNQYEAFSISVGCRSR